MNSISSLEKKLDATAAKVVRLLQKQSIKIVFSESCTGGEAAARLAQIPGVSEFFCGSFVVYRESSKANWLGVQKSSLKKFSAVSSEVAREMASGALQQTPEAQLAFSITGYLGPQAPKNQLGLIYLAAAWHPKKFRVIRLKLAKNDRNSATKSESRRKAQLLASLYFLLMVRSLLQARES